MYKRASSCTAVLPPPAKVNNLPSKPVKMDNNNSAAFPNSTTPQALLDNPTASGKLSARCDYELPIDLKQYFNLFVSDAAKYSCAEFYREGGDINICTGNWSQGCVLRAKDEFDFDQCQTFARERKTTLNCAYGNFYLQVERYHRYYYYLDAQVLMVRATTVTKGTRVKEMYITHERWIIEEIKGKRVHVRAFAGITFPKPTFSFIAGQIKRTADRGINREITRYYKRTTVFVTTVCVARDLNTVKPTTTGVEKPRNRRTKKRAPMPPPFIQPNMMIAILSFVIAILVLLNFFEK